jgi:hypothetical protein
MFRYMITLVALSTASMAVAQEAQETDSALALMNEVHKNYYYADDGGKARVGMVLTDKKGRTREREFWMLRTDVEDMGDQRYYTYFTKPADVRGTGFMVHKHADGDDSRWLYVPSVDLVRRIAADDRRSSFVGSDFTYEDVSGRIPTLDNHTMLEPEVLGDKEMLVVRSIPVDAGTADYSWRKTWIDADFRLPVQEEYYDDKDEVVRRFIVDKIEIIDDNATATQRTMLDVKKEHRTTITFTEVTYGVDLEADDYSERLLKNPPRSLR